MTIITTQSKVSYLHVCNWSDCVCENQNNGPYLVERYSYNHLSLVVSTLNFCLIHDTYGLVYICTLLMILNNHTFGEQFRKIKIKSRKKIKALSTEISGVSAVKPWLE